MCGCGIWQVTIRIIRVVFFSGTPIICVKTIQMLIMYASDYMPVEGLSTTNDSYKQKIYPNLVTGYYILTIIDFFVVGINVIYESILSNIFSLANNLICG